MSGLQGKVAIITGASSGIGRATAVAFAAHGCKVAIVGRNEENLAATKAECITQGKVSLDDVLSIKADLSQEDDAVRVVKDTVAKFNQLDILVNNAGIMPMGSTESTPLATYDQVMNVNVRSVFHLMQLSIPHLKKTKGNIVNVSSVGGLRAFAGISAYVVSKACLDQLTRTAALELAADGIRVNSVNPGTVATELHKRGGMSEEVYAKYLERAKTTHALGRVATVTEVASAIIFLASDDSSFTTGVTLPVDGGRAQMCPR